jgi:hypothetical protein
MCRVLKPLLNKNLQRRQILNGGSLAAGNVLDSTTPPTGHPRLWPETHNEYLRLRFPVYSRTPQ